MTELPFFASKVRLGRTGINEIYPLGPLNEYERLVGCLKTWGNIDCVLLSCPMLRAYVLCFSDTHLFTLFFFFFVFFGGGQGWIGEGKERVSRKHSEGGFFHQEMSRFPSFMFHFIPFSPSIS